MELEDRVMGNIWCSMLMENHYTYVVIEITCDCTALVLESKGMMTMKIYCQSLDMVN